MTTAPTLIIEERQARISADLSVGRLLPYRKQRLIGPFCFIDHMGPLVVGPRLDVDVGQHPHIGLSTLTYMLDGGFLHVDSVGSVQEIRPGAVNWMTAGRGVTHAEKLLEPYRAGGRLHGYQIWVALPREHEDDEPSFHHVPAQELPAWQAGALELRLVAGSLGDRRSPVPVYSPLYMLEVKTQAGGVFDGGGLGLFGEAGACVVSGSVAAGDARHEPGRLLVYARAADCTLELAAGTHLLVFGGEPLPEERFIDWNFVASDRAKIAAAVERWRARDFEMIPGEASYVPYPGD